MTELLTQEHDASRTTQETASGAESKSKWYREIYDGMRTGKGYEQLMQEANKQFEKVFGLTAVQKAFKDIAHTRGCYMTSDTDFDCLMVMSQEEDGENRQVYIHDVYLGIQKRLDNIRAEGKADQEAQRQVIMEATDQLLGYPTDDQEVNLLLNNYDDDRLLNIGDPFEVVNKGRNETSTVTVDMSPGIAFDKQVVHGTEDALYRNQGIADGFEGAGYPGVEDNWAYLQHKLRDLPPELVKQLKDVHQKTIQAYELTCDSVENDQHAAEAQALWHEVAESVGGLWHDEHLRTTDGQPIQLPNEEEDEELTDYLRVVDRVSKNARTSMLVAAVRKEIRRELSYVHIEVLAEAHIHRLSSVDDNYKQHWYSMLEAAGIESPEDSDPYSYGTIFVETLVSFLDMHPNYLHLISNDELRDEMSQQEQVILNQRVPYEPQTDRAQVINAVFPYETNNQLSPRSFDRILASWSLTTSTLGYMNNDDIFEMFSAIADLLADHGEATIVPIEWAGPYRDELDAILRQVADTNQVSCRIQWGGRERVLTIKRGSLEGQPLERDILSQS